MYVSIMLAIFLLQNGRRRETYKQFSVDKSQKIRTPDMRLVAAIFVTLFYPATYFRHAVSLYFDLSF